MNDDKISYLPVWKKGATAAERFMELSHVASKHPEMFEKFVVLYTEELDDGRFMIRKVASGKMNTAELVGMVTISAMDISNGI